VHRFHFLLNNLPHHEKEKAISKWVLEQILDLTKEGVLKAPLGKLSSQDFIILCNIVENRVKSYIFDEKSKLQEQRLQILKVHGLQSDEYF
jgi:hypothetical protein